MFINGGERYIRKIEIINLAIMEEKWDDVTGLQIVWKIKR